MIDKKNLDIISREYSRTVEIILNSTENKEFLAKIVLGYITNAIEFFKSKGMEFNTEDEFLMFIKANASQHINDTLKTIVDYYLENLKSSKVH